MEFFNLTTFLISNNFPDKANVKEIYRWLKEYGSLESLSILSNTKGPVAEAILENVFRLAVEAEDLPTVKYLLNLGANPNGSSCSHKEIPDLLTPLQYACIFDNIEMARELVEAGSSIDSPGSGWRRSILVLAITGHNLRQSMISRWGFYYSRWPSDEESNTQNREIPDEEAKHKNDSFMSLINLLIDRGAKINLEDIDDLDYIDSLNIIDSSENLKWREGHVFNSLFLDDHLPISAASKYRHKELVDFLIQKGANVNDLTGRETSAIQECIYSWEELGVDLEWDSKPPKVYGRQRLFRNIINIPDITSVVHSLLDAGAIVPSSTRYKFWARHKEDTKYLLDLSSLDLAILANSLELVRMVLSFGTVIVRPASEVSVQVASLDIFDYLIRTETPISKKTMRDVFENSLALGDVSWTTTLLDKRRDLQTRSDALIESIRHGSISTLDSILDTENQDSGPLLSSTPNLARAIQQCCRSGYLEVLRRILDKKFKYRSTIVSRLDCSILEAIHGSQKEQENFGHSTFFGKTASAMFDRTEEMVDVLLSAGADVNAVAPNYQTALTAAISIRNQGIIQKLLIAGAVVNTDAECASRTSQKHRPTGRALVAAIKWGNNAVIDDLLARGADINAPGSSYYSIAECKCQTPLVTAILERHWNLVNRLITAGAAIGSHPKHFFCQITPLEAAIRSQETELVHFLLRAGSSPEDAGTLEAAFGDKDLLQLLLTFFVNQPMPRNTASVVDQALNAAIKKKNSTAVSTILNSHMVDVNLFDGITSPLGLALIYDNTTTCEIVRMLLNSGADLGSTAWKKSHEEEKTALCLAVEMHSIEKVQLLLEARPRGSIKDSAGAIQAAVWLKNNCILGMLLDYGLDPNIVCRREDVDRPLQFQFQFNTIFRNQGMNSSFYPLCTAVVEKNLEMAKTLLDFKANPNLAIDRDGHTVLQIAVRDGGKDIVEMLLEYGADVNAAPAQMRGATALQFAAIQGFLGIAYLLLQHEADVNAPAGEFEGRTALEGAAEHGRIDMIQMLLNAGAHVDGDGQAQYERALERASKYGHHAARRLLEAYHERVSR